MLPMRTTPPFRADHVGSLLRPAAVLAARDDFAAGRIGADQLRAVEDKAIADVVAMQQNVGLQTATDGEFRRASWHMDFIYQIGGVSKAPGKMAVRFHNPGGDIEWTPAALHVGTKLHMAKTIFEEDFTYLKSLAGASTAKLTIPSPNMVHYRGGPAAIDPAVYPDIAEFWRDLSAAYADEVARLAALGCTSTCSSTTPASLYLNDPAQRAEIAGRGEDAEHLHLRYIRQVNDALVAKPGRHDGHHAPVPRPTSAPGWPPRRVRLRGRGAVQPAERRWVLPRGTTTSGPEAASEPLRFVPPARWSCSAW